MTLTPSEAGKVITACGWFDNRKLTEEAALAWSAAIDPRASVKDVLDAVAAHYTDTTDWCTPAHINRIIKDRREDRRRIAHAADIPYPAALAADPVTRDRRELVWGRAWLAAVDAGANRDQATAQTNAELNVEPDSPPLTAEQSAEWKAQIAAQAEKWSMPRRARELAAAERPVDPDPTGTLLAKLAAKAQRVAT